MYQLQAERKGKGTTKMTELTSYERMKRTYEHKDPDRVPITDWAWESTLGNWHKAGIPKDMKWEDYFGLENIARITELDIDTSPRCGKIIIEETESYRIEKDEWGITKKNWKPMSTTPMYLDFEIHDPDSWRIAKERMTPTRDRIDWSFLKTNYKYWRENNYWIEVGPWFGFDIVNSRTMGTETTLMAMVDDPEWIRDMVDTGCDLALSLLDMIWDEGYEFDELLFYDDLGYKGNLLISIDMYRDLVKPYQKRAIEWAHAKGLKTQLHSCGKVEPLIPDFIGIGLDCLNPLEVKAGMDTIKIKNEFGKDLALRGGFDIRNWTDPETAEEDIRAKLPALMEGSGYIFSSDHSIADTVTIPTYKHIVEVVKELGKY